MSKYLVCNQKMLMMPSDVLEFLNTVKGKLSNQVVLCPSSLYLPYYLKNNWQVGIQNVYSQNKGAYTGEVSPFQAKSLGVDFCIIGHSERRKYFHENNNEISDKISNALKCGLKVILCVGETLEEKSLNKTEFVLKKDLYQALVNQSNLDGLWIAYEPLWAIGTGQVASNSDINRIALFIKDVVKQYKNIEDIPILYGGSVSSDNIEELNKIPSIQGFLVGSASIKAVEVLKMQEVVENQ